MRETLRIANSNYIVDSNFDVDTHLSVPEAYSLHTNYYISDFAAGDDNTFRAVIEMADSDIEIALDNSNLIITGDMLAMFADGYNKQFSIFGNKGIFNHYILHTLELQGIVSLHGCSVIHPHSRRIIIAIGASGSGKSAFVTSALSTGWNLISTELVLIGSNSTLYRGNHFDNLSSAACRFTRAELTKAHIYDDSRLVEPIAERTMASFEEYRDRELMHKIQFDMMSLVILNFGNKNLRVGDTIVDKDFLTRFVQYAASEKICSPILFGDRIFPPIFCGDARKRSVVVNNIIRELETAIVLGGDFSDIQVWLSREYERRSV